MYQRYFKKIMGQETMFPTAPVQSVTRFYYSKHESHEVWHRQVKPRTAQYRRFHRNNLLFSVRLSSYIHEIAHLQGFDLLVLARYVDFCHTHKLQFS